MRKVDLEGSAPVPRRPAPGFPGLFVGDDGSVYGRSGQILKREMSRGVFFLNRNHSPAEDGRTWVPVVDVLCSAFHGRAPSPDHVAVNLSGDPWDTRPENVSWVSKNPEA